MARGSRLAQVALGSDWVVSGRFDCNGYLISGVGGPHSGLRILQGERPPPPTDHCYAKEHIS